jgi:hypothetical protein
VSAASLDPALAELLASKRLGSLEASRHRFTVSREEALLRLREQVHGRNEDRWDWTTLVVRAANALSEIAEAQIRVEVDETHETTTLDVITPGIELLAVDLSDVLGGALEPDLGEPLGGADPDQRLARFRALIGRALNAALAHDRVAIELQTPAGGRLWERREQPVEGRDPFVERKRAALDGRSRFVVKIVEPRPGLGSRLGRWLRSRSDTREALLKLWRAHRLADHEAANVDDEGRVSLGPALAAEAVALGSHALLGPCRGRADAPPRLRESLWLARDGLLLVDLGPSLRAHGLDPASLAGWIDCPSLRLTADERSVARDGNFELLLAWLQDFLARSDASGAVRWPGSLGDLPGGGPETASGRVVDPEQLADDARRGRELIYVWRHQAGTVPAYAKAKIFALWPSELGLIRARFPELRLVPLRAVGDHNDFDPADLTSLRTGSYEPLVLLKHSPFGGQGQPGAGALAVVLHLSIEAYVHRAPTASMGFIEILAYERRVAQVRERGKVFPGVTLICRVSGAEGGAEGGPELDVASLRRDHAAIATITELCRERTRAHWEGLLAHVMRSADAGWSAWETPLLRTALDELGPAAIDLRYQTGEQGLRLAWRDTVLLDVVVGRDASGADRSLRDALRQLREPGFLVLAHEHKRFEQLHSKDPRLLPWSVHDWARPLLERVLGRAALLAMPVVPEAHPLVLGDPVRDQRHLIRQRETTVETLQRSTTDPLARQRLLGHLLVARALNQDSFGLETVPLLDRYDPRALTTTRLVSLASILAERPRPGLVPAGAVHRGLPRPMIEVTPGIAALLAKVAELEPGATSGAPILRDDADPGDSRSAPVRRRARAVPALLASSVVHPLMIGRLQVAGDGSSEGIALWARGLRIGELELPEPLGRVSGRLLLTEQGHRIDRAVVRREVTGLARDLLADALRQRSLLPPDGPQRRRLDAFVEYARSVVRVEDRFGLADLLGAREAVDRGARFVALRQLSLGAAPLRPLSNRREALLVDVIRQSVAMALHFDTAVLSWRPAKLGKRRNDGSFELEFGLRNAMIKAALDEGRALSPAVHRHAALLAGVVVIASYFEQVRESDALELGPEHVVVAMWRLLKLV